MAQIEIRGESKRQEATAHQVLDSLIERIQAEKIPEPQARLLLQEEIDKKRVLATVMFDGNSIWSKKRILNELRGIKNGDGDVLLSNYLYHFFSLCCGSIAHYDKHGWIAEYPTVSALKAFFVRNEYGQNILDHQSRWHTDCIEIAKGIFDMFEIPYTK